MTQEIKYASLSPLQQRKEKQRGRFISEFKQMRKQFKDEGMNPSVESLCRILSGKYGKSILTLRRYLKAEGEI